MNNKDRAWAEISLDNIAENFMAIKTHTKSKVMCVIKADAYGHGSLQVAKTLERVNADYFGVATLNEAIMLRESGISTPILLLGFFEDKYINDVIQNDITVTVYDFETAVNISDFAEKTGQTVKIHIKIDTGMSRLGFLTDDFHDILKICKFDGIFVEGIFTHFAVADCADKKENTFLQANKFSEICEKLKENQVEIPIKHVSASGAILQYDELNFDMVRAGIILYGYAPDSAINHDLKLKPAMTLLSKVAQVKCIKKGQSVSYGMNFIAPKDMKIAIITIGYADGYSRLNSSKGYFYFKNQKVNIIGNICMDMCIVDISDVENIKKGDNIVIFGNSGECVLGADEVSKFSDTIAYEILCSVSKRVPRIYAED